MADRSFGWVSPLRKVFARGGGAGVASESREARWGGGIRNEVDEIKSCSA